ncbi:MAG TPA: phosphatase domain-containing protein, partial [Prolixibacteraceae bacterium]|nr:phosphatase domain-containing protein [Prolixibacteraceae bacterium]
PVFRFIKKPFRRALVWFKQKAGWLGVPKIVPFRGYGTSTDVFLKGIVVEDKGLAKPHSQQMVWHNFLTMVKRFWSDEIPGVRVKVVFRNCSEVVETDENGFFTLHFKLSNAESLKIKSGGWFPVYFELLDEVVENQPSVHARGQVRIVADNNKRILVSDIDDTVLISYSTQVLRKLRLMFFKNAHTRLPFHGVAQFYRSLVKGADGQRSYPFFYVSSSEWNLYDLLSDFFAINHLPAGVFMLKELNHSILKFWKTGSKKHTHKKEKIEILLNLFDGREFILIGDSGQNDPYIYSEIAEKYPGRIKAVYIRCVGRKRHKSEQRIKNHVSQFDVDMVLVNSTSEAEVHALKKGYINLENV